MVKLDKHSSLVLVEVVGGPCNEDFMGQVILFCVSSREGPKNNGYEYHPLGATFRPLKFKSKAPRAKTVV